jgi:hypothetical protein
VGEATTNMKGEKRKETERLQKKKGMEWEDEGDRMGME